MKTREAGAKAIGIGRGAIANADVVQQKSASVDIGAKVSEIADKVMQTVTKDTPRDA